MYFLQVYWRTSLPSLWTKGWAEDTPPCMDYLALPVTGVVHWVRIETFKLVWREEETPLMAFNLCKEILLLVIMRRSDVA